MDQWKLSDVKLTSKLWLDTLFQLCLWFNRNRLCINRVYKISVHKFDYGIEVFLASCVKQQGVICLIACLSGIYRKHGPPILRTALMAPSNGRLPYCLYTHRLICLYLVHLLFFLLLWGASDQMDLVPVGCLLSMIWLNRIVIGYITTQLIHH